MNKLTNILILLTIFAVSVSAQEHELSKMDDKSEQELTSEQQKETIIGAQLDVLLKTDNTWVVNNEKYITLTTENGEKYVLFADGKWSDIMIVKDIDENPHDTAQERELSNINDKLEQKDTILSVQLNILLKTDSTWVVNNEKYIKLTTENGKKYVLFANGKWSDIITVKDIDENSYDAAKIGKYYWTLQNLQTTKYNNGAAITFAPANNDAWRSSTGAYTNVEDKPENKGKQGLLYSWHAADNPNLCPKGWSVPTETEWLDLLNYVGGSSAAGKELKSTDGWRAFEGSDKKTAGEDNYMFNAIPTGYRQLHADKRNFYQVGGEATFWSKTSKTKSQAVSITFTLNENVIRGHWPKEFGRSIRCIKK